MGFSLASGRDSQQMHTDVARANTLGRDSPLVVEALFAMERAGGRDDLTGGLAIYFHSYLRFRLIAVFAIFAVERSDEKLALYSISTQADWYFRSENHSSCVVSFACTILPPDAPAQV